MQLVERRQLRSERAQEALSLQLAHLQRNHGLLAFLLADADGFLLASAPAPFDLETVAAHCPLLARGAISLSELSQHFSTDHEIAVALLPVVYQGETLFLLAASPHGPQAAQAIRDAQSGILRILGNVRL
jgi:hypothetical protein